MPARPLVANVVQVVFAGKVGAYNWVNKVYVKYSGVFPLNVDLTTYAGALMTAWIADMTGLQRATSSIESIEVTDLASATGSVGLATGHTVGTRAGTELPGEVCALISKRTARHYRGGHPRTYLSVGVNDDTATASTWAGGFVVAVNAGWGGIETALVAGTGSFAPTEEVNVSYFSGTDLVSRKPIPRVVPLVDAIIPGSSHCQPQFAVQRRRIGRK